MRFRLFLCALAIAVCAACGGGGGGGGVTPNPPVTHTPVPTQTPAPYATLPPASTRQGDVRTLATGGGGAAIAYLPDYNIVVVGVGSDVIDPADGSILAIAPEISPVVSIAYSSSAHSIVFATLGSIYSKGTTGGVVPVATNFSGITSVAVATDGTIYAIDTDHIIKIVNGAAVNVTPPGSIGAPIPPVFPSLVFASDGSMLVSDPGNDVIWHVTTAGNMTPFAGGCKSGANGFTGTSGNCWRAAQAGTGSNANFETPGALAYDAASGTLYVCDYQSNQIWAVSASGVASPVAGYGASYNIDGNGLAAFLRLPTAIAFQSSNKTVDILESAQGSPQEIAAYTTSGTAPPAYTPPAVPFYFPSGLTGFAIAATSDGGAWASDEDGKHLDRISASGSVTRYAAPSGITPSWHNAADATGNGWFLASRMSGGIIQDQGVLEVTPSGSETYVPATLQHAGATGFVEMQDMTIGPDGNPWFTESETSLYGGSYGFVNASTHAITQYATPFVPNGISQAPSGNLAVSAQVNSNPSIVFVSTTGQTIASYTGVGNVANNLQYRSGDGTIWVPDNASIDSMTSTGSVHQYTVCGSCAPYQIAITPDGSVWSDTGFPGVINRVTPGGTVEPYMLPMALGPTNGISARPDGKLWVYDTYGVLYLFDPSVYDAMNGPHVTPAFKRHGVSAGTRTPWHKR
jgi:streptogramin lyase